MNPVLLKPGGARRSHLVLRGRPLTDVSARNYRGLHPQFAGCHARLEDRVESRAGTVEGLGLPPGSGPLRHGQARRPHHRHGVWGAGDHGVRDPPRGGGADRARRRAAIPRRVPARRRLGDHLARGVEERRVPPGLPARRRRPGRPGLRPRTGRRAGRGPCGAPGPARGPGRRSPGHRGDRLCSVVAYEELQACLEAGVPCTMVPGVFQCDRCPQAGRCPGHLARDRARVHRGQRPPAARAPGLTRGLAGTGPAARNARAADGRAQRPEDRRGPGRARPAGEHPGRRRAERGHRPTTPAHRPARRAGRTDGSRGRQAAGHDRDRAVAAAADTPLPVSSSGSARDSVPAQTFERKTK